MLKNDTRTDRQWLALTLIAILGITVWRILLLPYAGIDLFVDETQYWLWGREMAFGHYSKPPGIGWLIRATTFLTGSESAFSLRLSLPVLHGLTAVMILILGEEVFELRAAALAAISYVTLPVVAVGSLLISTDTPMLFFIAASLAIWSKLRHGPHLGLALLLGLCLGLGMMSKYAMSYAWIGLALVAILVPTWRIGRRDGAVAVIVAAIVVAPNIWWNLQHDMATLRHTADNADWQGTQVHPDRALRFVLEQFAVAGPVIFAAMLIQFLRPKRVWEDEDIRAMVLLALPALVAVTVQAFLSRAYANWAVGAYVAGTVLAVDWLAHRAPRLMKLSLILNGFIALAVPIAITQAADLRRPDGELLLRRHLGQAEISARALQATRAAGGDVIVAHDRGLLADLFYRTRKGGPQIFAVPQTDPVPHHYALIYPLPADRDGTVLYLSYARNAIPCTDPDAPVAEVASWTAGTGHAEGQEITLRRVPADCWR
ncbi:ArnT family glycosyltransferase [Halodurantibacterium flavum]|uniref:ArnT family glycosyltransferase n=1 Tax=Halodurantibacterium flavum TaxID=1382802 RepID=A0ABW4S5F2_9RHOB